MQDLPSRLRQMLASQEESLIAAYLYGSRARGDAREDSDVDLGLLYREPPARSLESPPFRLATELEIELGRTVDAVVLNDAPPDLIQRVLRDGILVLDRSPSERLRFEVKARNEYFDMLPILELYRRKGRPAG